MELEQYCRPTSSKLCVSSHDASTAENVVNKFDRRRLFTARYYASAVQAMALCLSVRLSVRHKSVFY